MVPLSMEKLFFQISMSVMLAILGQQKIVKYLLTRDVLVIQTGMRLENICLQHRIPCIYAEIVGGVLL